jgi:putative membrane protein
LIGGATCALPASECAAHVASIAAFEHTAFDAVLAGLLAASSIVYTWGVASLWRKAGTGRGICVADVVCFALGMLVLAAALLSPIDRLAERSFAMHMAEHEMLMVLAAPLLVLARPLEACAWALPGVATRAIVRIARTTGGLRVWRSSTSAVGATCVHALALWIWHVPPLFAAALASEPLHVLQHVCFFASALAFWWAMFGAAARVPGAVSIACLFVTMLHTSALGALLTLAPSPWYVHSARTGVFGLDTIEDQQLGGLIMWVPGGIAYLVASLLIVGSWLSPPRMHRNAG